LGPTQRAGLNSRNKWHWISCSML